MCIIEFESIDIYSITVVHITNANRFLHFERLPRARDTLKSTCLVWFHVSTHILLIRCTASNRNAEAVFVRMGKKYIQYINPLIYFYATSWKLK